MLQYEVAKKLYKEIKDKAEKCHKEGFEKFYSRFLRYAVDYARNRTEWTFMDQAARTEDDQSRSMKHVAYMSMLGAICRNLGIEGIDELMPDRKTKGDFACYVALFLALKQR